MNGMVNWKNINSSPMAKLNRNQRLLDIVLARKNTGSKGKRDLFIRSSNSIGEIGLYTPSVPKTVGKVSDEILDIINFGPLCNLETPESFIIGGVEYLKKDIPPISLDRCQKPKAENNAIVFEKGKYYQFMDEKGNAHILTCSRYGGLTQPHSDVHRGVRDNTSYEVGQFWNILAGDGTYIGSYYSEETERRLLNDAGITEGFFSVQVGEDRQEYYYSNGNAGTAVPKERYENTYRMFMTMTETLFRDYKPGDVFLVGGKEYVLSEDRKLDLPYGADVYDVKWPPRNRTQT